MDLCRYSYILMNVIIGSTRFNANIIRTYIYTILCERHIEYYRVSVCHRFRSIVVLRRIMYIYTYIENIITTIIIRKQSQVYILYNIYLCVYLTQRSMTNLTNENNIQQSYAVIRVHILYS